MLYQNFFKKIKNNFYFQEKLYETKDNFLKEFGIAN